MPRQHSKPAEKNAPPEVDYIGLVDSFNDGAFELAVSQLFPLFRYKVLAEGDVRPVDLKEKLLELSKLYFGEKEKGKETILKVYSEVLTEYLMEQIPVKEGSRAEKYRDRALDLIKEMRLSDGSVNDLEDAVLIFVSLIKPLRGSFNGETEKVVSEPDFDVSPRDAKILEEFWMSVIRPPEQGKGLNPFKKRQLSKEMVRLHTLVYMNSVLLLCRILQQRGAFVTEAE